MNTAQELATLRLIANLQTVIDQLGDQVRDLTARLVAAEADDDG